MLGLVALVVTLTLDYRTLHRQVALHLHRHARAAALRAVLRRRAMGARRWIALGGFNLQPSEFAKIGVALVLAKFFGESRGAPGVDRSRDRRRAHRSCRSRSSPRSRTSARRSRCCRCCSPSPISPACRCASSASSRCACCSRRRSRGSSRSRTIRRADLDVPRSVAGCEGRRVPADPGAHHRRIGRA